MFYQRSCLAFAFLAMMGLLAFSEPASAQKGGGGKGGGGGGPKMGGGGGGPKGGGGGGGPRMGGGGGPRPGYPGGGYYRGSTYNRGGYYGGGFYGGLYFGGPSYYYLGGPIYYSSPYYYPYSYIYPTQRYSFYPDTIPSYSYVPPAPAVIDNRASIRVLVPVDDAKVLFDGSPTKQTGTDRYFHTPELDPNGGPYSYRIRAQWKQGDQEVIQERVVEVTPGKTAVADFR